MSRVQAGPETEPDNFFTILLPGPYNRPRLVSETGVMTRLELRSLIGSHKRVAMLPLRWQTAGRYR